MFVSCERQYHDKLNSSKGAYLGNAGGVDSHALELALAALRSGKEVLVDRVGFGGGDVALPMAPGTEALQQLVGVAQLCLAALGTRPAIALRTTPQRWHGESETRKLFPFPIC